MIRDLQILNTLFPYKLWLLTFYSLLSCIMIIPEYPDSNNCFWLDNRFAKNGYILMARGSLLWNSAMYNLPLTLFNYIFSTSRQKTLHMLVFSQIRVQTFIYTFLCHINNWHTAETEYHIVMQQWNLMNNISKSREIPRGWIRSLKSKEHCRYERPMRGSQRLQDRLGQGRSKPSPIWKAASQRGQNSTGL